MMYAQKRPLRRENALANHCSARHGAKLLLYPPDIQVDSAGGAFESTSGNGNDSVGALPCVSDRKGLVQRHMKTYNIFEFRSLGLTSLLGRTERRLRIGTKECRKK